MNIEDKVKQIVKAENIFPADARLRIMKEHNLSFEEFAKLSNDIRGTIGDKGFIGQPG
jgi:hypothetical protein